MNESDGLEKEIVELHDAWFAAAAAKDLDAATGMAATDLTP